MEGESFRMQIGEIWPVFVIRGDQNHLMILCMTTLRYISKE